MSQPRSRSPEARHAGGEPGSLFAFDGPREWRLPLSGGPGNQPNLAPVRRHALLHLRVDETHLDFLLSSGWLDFRMARPWRDDLFDIAFLQKEAERRSEAQESASEQERSYFNLMASLSATMAANETMRAWLERSIQELMAEGAGAGDG